MTPPAFGLYLAPYWYTRPKWPGECGMVMVVVFVVLVVVVQGMRYRMCDQRWLVVLVVVVVVVVMCDGMCGMCVVVFGDNVRCRWG